MPGLPHSRLMSAQAPRCRELRIQDGDQSRRIIYRMDEDAIVIAAVFSRKTGKTPKAVLDSSRQRLRAHDADLQRASMGIEEDKKRRLEKAGWKIGSAEDFLDLTAEERAFLNVKIAPAAAVRDWRASRSMTQTEVARLVRSSRSQVAKMEAADPTVSLDLVFRTLLTLGAPLTELGRTIGGAETRHQI